MRQTQEQRPGSKTTSTQHVSRAEQRASRLGSETGAALPADVRETMESRFQADFSKVRVHSDCQAAALAEQFNAHAVTIGNHVAFNTAQYAPRSARGQQLLAHELTHVMQQRDARGSPAVTDRDTRDEHEADTGATRACLGLPVPPPSRMHSGLRIQADEKKDDRNDETKPKADQQTAPPRVIFVLRAPDDAYTQNVIDYVENTLGEKVVRVDNLDEAADYLASQAKAGGGKVASVRIIGHGSTTGGIKMTPGGETERRFVSAEELEKMAADKKLKAKASGAMADGATVEFWGCYIGANSRSTQAVSDIFGSDVKAIDETLRTTHDSFARQADKGESGQKAKGRSGEWVEVSSTAEIDDRVKAGNKNLGESFNRWLLTQAKLLEADGDLPPQPDDKARIAAMRDLFDRSAGKIRRLEIKTGKGTTRRSDGKKWLDHWRTTKVK